MPRSKSQLNEVMTFGEHLEALRWHLIRATVGVAICLVGCLIVGQSLLRFLLAPAQRALAAHNAGAIVVNNFLDGLVAFFQISMVGGLLLASPWVVYQLWGFVSPGLYPRERRFVFRSVPFLVVLFLAGSLFGWLVALPSSLDFMVRFNQGAGFQHQIAVAGWATFALVFPMAFGVAFELPLGMVVLSKIGMVNVAGFRKKRRYAILIAAIISAMLTPSPHPLDMILMLAPLVLLYEGGIWCVWLIDRRQKSAATTQEDDKDESNDLIACFLLPLVTGPARHRATLGHGASRI
jgi:sec-independent protein translocase protein TatC